MHQNIDEWREESIDNNNKYKFCCFRLCILIDQLTRECWLLLNGEPLSETLLISFSVISIIEAVSFTGAERWKKKKAEEN